MPLDRSMPGSGRGHAQIADHNERAILEALRRNGPMTRLELAGLMGLSAPGVTNIIRRHLADGMIVEGQRKTLNAQVPSAEYALRPEGAFAIGMRLRGAVVEAVLVDLSGKVHRRDEARREGDAIETIVTLSRRMVEGNRSLNIVGAGLAIGTFDDIDTAALRRRLPELDLVVELDTVAAVLAERTIGAGVPDDGLIVVLMERNIRAGLFLHSIPFAGVRGKAGRLGDMRTGKDRVTLNEVCSTDAFYAAVAGLEGEAREHAIVAWMENASEHLLEAMMAIAGFVAPGKIVLAGDLPADIVSALIARVLELRGKMRMDSPAPVMPPLASAVFLQDSVLRGAAFLSFFNLLLPRPFAG